MLTRLTSSVFRPAFTVVCRRRSVERCALLGLFQHGIRYLSQTTAVSSQKKIYDNFYEAVQDIPHGAKLLVGGERARRVVGRDRGAFVA